MASAIMHLAISDRVLREFPDMDRNRFLLGSMLPDAAVAGNGHRKINVCNGTKKTYDFPGFREQFREQLKKDALYLGYYLHLVQDIVFRNYVYKIHHWNPLPEGNVERLHNDYAITNRYIIERYGLKPDIALPDGIEKEPLFADCRFDFEGFLRNFGNYFTEQPEGEIFFFTKEMADECIGLCLKQCIAEVNALKAGAGYIDEIALAWDRQA
ncbi:MAG: zinc dependent phospholipase C family protein [Lachnospiraceae bacterium]|nr:zinc dependent phospholipase C family protein [Lachnospiraceae bacterium]